jgi:hypothetical protein
MSQGLAPSPENAGRREPAPPHLPVGGRPAQTAGPLEFDCSWPVPRRGACGRSAKLANLPLFLNHFKRIEN